MRFDPGQPNDLSLLPPKTDLSSINFSSAIIKARSALAELKGYGFAMPNPLLLLSPEILRESLASSEIESIHTTIIDVLKNQLFSEPERDENDKEVLRYREAALWGFNKLNDFGISSRLILGIKRRLVKEGSGSYRRTQNAIANQLTGEILYMPPPAQNVLDLISNWERFVNNTKDGIDPLIKVAVAHYQFEAIHPFEDGNGRTGRILMVLQLVNSGILELPILFISGYIKNNQHQYYTLLHGVTLNNEWKPFIDFILEGLYVQAVETKNILVDIMQLFTETRATLREKYKKIYSADLAEALFAYPIITPAKLAKVLNVHYTTATRYLNELLAGGILKDQKAGKYHLYINIKLLNLMRKKSNEGKPSTLSPNLRG